MYVILPAEIPRFLFNVIHTVHILISHTLTKLMQHLKCNKTDHKTYIILGTAPTCFDTKRHP
jgi:hypothetical protein